MSKGKFNKKILYDISLIIDMFSFVKIEEIWVPEPFTDLSTQYEVDVFIYKKWWVNFYYSLHKKTHGEWPENILFLAKSPHDVILTVLTEKEKHCKLSMIQQYFKILMPFLQHIDSVIKAYISKPVEKNIGNQAVPGVLRSIETMFSVS